MDSCCLIIEEYSFQSKISNPVLVLDGNGSSSTMLTIRRYYYFNLSGITYRLFTEAPSHAIQVFGTEEFLLEEEYKYNHPEYTFIKDIEDIHPSINANSWTVLLKVLFKTLEKVKILPRFFGSQSLLNQYFVRVINLDNYQEYPSFCGEYSMLELNPNEVFS
jgi:hypothetical protein